jgi:hypothetical protein
MFYLRNKSMKKARKALKGDDYVMAKEHLVEAKQRYSGLQDMLELSQADSVASLGDF